MLHATRKYIEEGKDQQGKGYDPRKLLAPGFEAIKATVKEKMELFGSVRQSLRHKRIKERTDSDRIDLTGSVFLFLCYDIKKCIYKKINI